MDLDVRNEHLAQLVQSSSGKVYLDLLQKDFDDTIKALLAADAASLPKLQGRLSALHDQLQRFQRAYIAAESQRKRPDQ